jgi:iron transport multicopper oxidase
MTVIEADGENTAPLTVDSIRIYPAQRYSVVVKADQHVGNYWIRAIPNRGSGGNMAILRYLGAPVSDPLNDPGVALRSVLPFNEIDLHALENPVPPGKPFAGGADVVLNLAQTIDQPSVRFFVNGVGFAPPATPVLLQILSGAQAAQNLLPKGSVYLLPSNKVIEISIPGLFPGGPVSIVLQVVKDEFLTIVSTASLASSWCKSLESMMRSDL